MMWKYSNPVKIIFSNLSYAKIGKIIEDNKKVIVVCSNRFQNTGDFKYLKTTLKDFETFTDIVHNPTFESCQKAISFAEKFRPDALVAIGGGSVIDTAKVMRMSVYKSCSDAEKLFECLSNCATKPLFITIPTTHGSGSELTMWATIWDKVSKKKYSLSEYDNYPDYAIYDRNLLESLPISVSLSSTLDALSHSFEALWNKNSNPVSDHFAMEAIKLIINHLDKLRNPISIDVRTKLMMASMYAGLAFSNTETAAAHSISYPLLLHFNIPHGIACSMPLYSLLKINEKAMHGKIDNLLTILKLTSIDELWYKVLKTLKGKIPFTLREYGVKKKDLNWLLDLAFTKDRMENNIADLDEGDVLKILNEIY